MKMARHTNRAARSAFTLIEMLVVIAIISVVATASVSSIRGAARQARSAKCQANMHSLFKAVSAYRADNNVFPPAAGYEVFDSVNGTYIHKRGWVNWVLESGNRSRRKDKTCPYYGKSKNVDIDSASHAGEFRYVGTGAFNDDVSKQAVHRSIDEGAIFAYADKSMSIYCCDEFKATYGQNSMRSYAMNNIFGSGRNRINPLRWDTPGFANRLAVFVEIGNAGLKKPADALKSKVGGSASGVAGDAKDSSSYWNDDSVWDWDKDENIGVMHRKSGRMFGHVIFADGHLEALEIPKSSSDQKEQREDLGNGGYGD